MPLFPAEANHLLQDIYLLLVHVDGVFDYNGYIHLT